MYYTELPPPPDEDLEKDLDGDDGSRSDEEEAPRVIFYLSNYWCFLEEKEEEVGQVVQGIYRQWKRRRFPWFVILLWVMRDNMLLSFC